MIQPVWEHHDDECESERKSHGYTPCLCRDRLEGDYKMSMTCGLCKQPIQGDQAYHSVHYRCDADLTNSWRSDLIKAEVQRDEAVKLLRDIVNAWEGADWCADAATFLKQISWTDDICQNDRDCQCRSCVTGRSK